MLIGYTLYRNVLPWPSTLAGRVIVIMAAIWVIAAVVGIIVLPARAAKIGNWLAQDEGLAHRQDRPDGRRGSKRSLIQMTVRIDDAWTYHGLRVVKLENEFLTYRGCSP